MDDRPVGIFDTGYGGLTALSAFRKCMPDENIIFFGDNSRAPYGPRPVSQIKQFTSEIIGYLESRGVKAMLAACGTISLNAPDILKSASVPVLNVVKPSVEYLASLKGSSPLGIIATEASIKSGGYVESLRRAGVKREIITSPCYEYAAFVEQGLAWSDERVRKATEQYLEPLKKAGVKTVLLGCTHYGALSRAISAYLGADTELVSASCCGAGALAEFLNENNLSGGNGNIEYCTSGDAESFKVTGSAVLGEEILNVTHVGLNRLTI